MLERGVPFLSDTAYRLASNHCFDISFPYFMSHDVLQQPLRFHRHDFVEIEFLIAGSGTEKMGGISHRILPGNLSVLMPWHIHSLIPDEGETLEFLKCSFNVELFLESGGPLFELKDLAYRNLNVPNYIQLEGADTDKMIILFRELLEEFSAVSTAWREVYFQIKVSEILILFDRKRQESHETADNAVGAWRVIEYIHLHYPDNLSAASVARLFGFSKDALDEKLLEQTALDFDRLLLETRIRSASSMLIYHQTSIGEIARAVGYQSEETFYRAFKSVKGISPGNFRKKNNGISEKVMSPLHIDAKIIYHLHKHYKEDITLQDVAKTYHYNENYLSDLLKAQTGQSFLELLHEIRIYHACVLLLTTDLPVTKVGFDIGFHSNETFQRVFKKARGITPGEYRKSNKEK